MMIYYEKTLGGRGGITEKRGNFHCALGKNHFNKGGGAKISYFGQITPLPLDLDSFFQCGTILHDLELLNLDPCHSKKDTIQ